MISLARYPTLFPVVVLGLLLFVGYRIIGIQSLFSIYLPLGKKTRLLASILIAIGVVFSGWDSEQIFIISNENRVILAIGSSPCLRVFDRLDFSIPERTEELKMKEKRRTGSKKRVGRKVRLTLYSYEYIYGFPFATTGAKARFVQ